MVCRTIGVVHTPSVMLSGVAGFALGRETPVFMGTDGFNEFSADRQHDVRRGQELLHSRAHEAAPEVQWKDSGTTHLPAQVVMTTALKRSASPVLSGCASTAPPPARISGRF